MIGGICGIRAHFWQSWDESPFPLAVVWVCDSRRLDRKVEGQHVFTKSQQQSCQDIPEDATWGCLRWGAPWGPKGTDGLHHVGLELWVPACRKLHCGKERHDGETEMEHLLRISSLLSHFATWGPLALAARWPRVCWKFLGSRHLGSPAGLAKWTFSTGSSPASLDSGVWGQGPELSQKWFFPAGVLMQLDTVQSMSSIWENPTPLVSRTFQQETKSACLPYLASPVLEHAVAPRKSWDSSSWRPFGISVLSFMERQSSCWILPLAGNSVEISFAKKREKNQNQRWKQVSVFFCMILKLVK